MHSLSPHLWNVVDECKENCDRQEVLLDGEVLQGVDDGKVALQRHRHRHVHGPRPGDVQRSVAKRDQVDRDVSSVP